MPQLPDLSGRIVIDTSDLDGAVQSAATKGSAIGSAIGSAVGNLAAGGLAAAAGAVSNFVTGSVSAFAELEDATAAAGTTFGASMPQIEQFAADAAKNFGLSASEATNAAITMGTFGKAAGLAGDDLAGFSTETVALAGDLASFRGVQPEVAVQALGGALRGEYEGMRQFGVLLDEATIKNRAMQMGLIATTDEALTPQQKVLAAQAEIIAQTGDAQGDFARTSESTANTQKRLTAEMENQQAALGAKLAPAMVAVQEAALVLLDNIGVLGDKFVALKGWIEDNIVVLGLIAAALVAMNIQVVIAAVSQAAWNAVMLVTRGYIVAWTAAQWLLNAAMSANPLGIIIGLILLLVAGLVYAWKNSETFREVVKKVWEGIKNAVQAAWDWIKGAFQAMVDWFGRIGQNASDLWNRITGAFNGIRDAIGNAIANVGNVIRGIPGTISNAIGNLGGLLLHAGQAVVQGLIDGIRNKIGAVGDAARAVVQKVKDFLPFSPAKEGPLSGKGAPVYSGRAISRQIAEGLAYGTPAVAAAMNATLTAAAPGTAAAANPNVGVRVFIGDQELRGMVRTEVGSWEADTARTLAYGVA